MDEEKGKECCDELHKLFVKKVFEFVKRFYVKILIVLIFSSFLSGSLVLMVQNTRQFFKNEKVALSSYEKTSSLEFPALTICSKNQYKEEVLKRFGVQSRRSYVMNTDWIGNGENEPWRIFEESVIPVQEIIEDLKIYLDTPTLDGQTIISLSPTGRFCEMNLFDPKEHFYFGRCHSLIIPDCLQKLGVSEIVFVLNNEVDIYLHDKNDFLNPDTKAKISIALGSSAKISINNELIVKIDNCNSHYNFDQCMDRSLGVLLESSMNCTVPWVGDKKKICKTQYTQTRAYQIFQENRKNQKRLCEPSCKHTNIQFGPINYDKVSTNQGRAVFFFPHNVQVDKEKSVYDFSAFLTDIAGLVSLVAIIIFLIFKVVSKENRKSSIRRVSVSSSTRPRVSVNSVESSSSSTLPSVSVNSVESSIVSMPRVSGNSVESSIVSRQPSQTTSQTPINSAGSQKSWHE